MIEKILNLRELIRFNIFFETIFLARLKNYLFKRALKFALKSSNLFKNIVAFKQNANLDLKPHKLPIINKRIFAFVEPKILRNLSSNFLIYCVKFENFFV